MRNYKKEGEYPYHSFWLKESDYEPLTEVEYLGNFGFLFDLSDKSIPLPLNLDMDVIFSEISFLEGYGEFSARAKPEGNYKDYIKGLERLIYTYNVPVYVIGPKNIIQGIHPDRILPIRVDFPMEQFDGYLAVWRDDEIEVQSRTEALQYLNSKRLKVYDPCCGYLSIARFMPDCKFLFSDVNPKCLGGSLATLKELNSEKTNEINKTDN
ncbi:MAG TPA: hypothetical protein PK074_11490 [Spirochaetales bacterium]|mgnify:CR=1 FL=1|nr:hypothetical protein [Spirochaetales bacterium]